MQKEYIKTSLKSLYNEDSLNSPLDRGVRGDDLTTKDPFKIWKDQGLSQEDRKGNYKLYLSSAQGRFFSLKKLSFEDSQLIYKLYSEWRNYDQFLVIGEEKTDEFGQNRLIDAVSLKMAKRGNDVHRWRVRKRASKMLDWIRQNINSPIVDKFNRTNIVEITFTVNPKKMNFAGSWVGNPYKKRYFYDKEGRLRSKHLLGCQCVSCEFNRAVSALKSKYGNIDVLRSYETQIQRNLGYAHVHAVLLFRDHKFKTHLHENKKGQINLRLDYGIFAKYWSDGFIDVKVPFSLRKILDYTLKHVLKAQESLLFEEDQQIEFSNCLNWLFRKQSYSIGQGFYKSLVDLNNNCVAQTNKPTYQLDLDGHHVTRRVVLGSFDARRVHHDGHSWKFRLKKEVRDELYQSYKAVEEWKNGKFA